MILFVKVIMYILLDDYTHHLVRTLLDCSYHCFPCHRSPSSHELIGWNDGPNFWYRVWDQAGGPSTGAIFNLKKLQKGNINLQFVAKT